MKVRAGYVSNSSSSSFILAWNNGGAVCASNFKMNMDKFLRYIDSLSNYSCEATQVENSTKYGVIQHLEENDWEDKDQIIKKLEKYDNACFIRINYDDEMTRDLLQWMKDNGVVDVILDYND